LAGDLNARTAKLADFLPSDSYINDFFNIDDDSRSHFDSYSILENLGVPLCRNSLDTRTNSHGLMLIELCRNNNLFIVNGRFGNDANTGKFTFRDRSAIDYLIVSTHCFKYLQDFSVLEIDGLFSDGHSVLYWSISVPPDVQLFEDYDQFCVFENRFGATVTDKQGFDQNE
jgi:hypothetical protein